MLIAQIVHRRFEKTEAVREDDFRGASGDCSAPPQARWPIMPRWNNQIFGLLILIIAGSMWSGCTSKRAAQERAQAAYLAGQNAALMRQQDQISGVTVIGPVQNSHIPWVVGLTLTQALATANYLDSQTPKQIIITRNGESATLDPKTILEGHDIPLEVGDVIEIHP